MNNLQTELRAVAMHGTAETFFQYGTRLLSKLLTRLPGRPRGWPGGNPRQVMDIAARYWDVPLYGEDICFIHECVCEGIYTREPGFAPEDGWTCVDAGANIGACTLAWQRSNPNGRIVSFEPHPYTFERLCRNLDMNGAENVTPVHAALGTGPGSLQLFVRPNRSMATGQAQADSRAIHVEQMSLDAYCEAQDISALDLLKIDVEGAEDAVLQGAVRMLAHTERVVIEFHSVGLRERTCATLEGAGFEIVSCEDHLEIGLLFARR